MSDADNPGGLLVWFDKLGSFTQVIVFLALFPIVATALIWRNPKSPSGGIKSVLTFLVILLSFAVLGAALGGNNNDQTRSQTELARKEPTSQSTPVAEKSAQTSPKPAAQEQTGERSPEDDVSIVLDASGAAPYEIAGSRRIDVKAISGSLSENSPAKIDDAPTNKRAEYRVVVPPGIKQEQVKPTINSLILAATKKDNDLDEVMVLSTTTKKTPMGCTLWPGESGLLMASGAT